MKELDENITPANIGGMGPVKLPTDTEVGSGDVPSKKKYKKDKKMKKLIPTFENFVKGDFKSVTESLFSFKTDNVEQLHFETDPKRAELMKMELGKSQGAFGKKNQIEDAEYSLRRFRKSINYGDGKDVGVFLPGSYDASVSKLGDGPHKKAAKKVKWTQKKYDQWLEDMAANGGAENAFDMAQNAKNETGLIDWVKKQFRGDDPLQRIQWDIEGYAESVVTEAFIGPFVFNDKMSDDELLGMYNGALDGYANYSKGFQHSKSDYKQAYQEIEKILKKRGVNVDESVVTEANKGKVHKAAKQGSYPAVIVVVQDGKVIHQEAVSTPAVAPATFNVMQEKYPKALIHLEDKTGKRLFSESLVTEASEDRMIKQIERALKDGTSIFKLPMATQKYYNKNKSDFESVVTEAFSRMSKDVIENELYSASQELSKYYDWLKAGNDSGKGKTLDKIIDLLKKCKGSIKRFNKPEEVEGTAYESVVTEVVDLVHVYGEDGKMFGTGELVKTKGKKSLIRWDGSKEEWIDSKLVKVVESKESDVKTSKKLIPTLENFIRSNK